MQKNKVLLTTMLLAPVLFLSYIIFYILTANSAIAPSLNFRLAPIMLIPLSSVVLNVYLLILVNKNRKTIKGVAWLGLFLLGVLTWSLTDLFTFAAASRYTALIVRAGIPLSSMVGIPALLMFLLHYTRDDADNNVMPWLLTMATSFLVIILALASNFIFHRDAAAMIPRFWGYEIVLGPLGVIYLAWFQMLSFIIIGLLVKFYLGERKTKRKKQATLMLIGVMIPIVGSTLTNVIPAYLNLPFYLPLDSFFSTLMAVVMCYGIIRYSLFSINPASIATNILETMAETVIVTDPKFELEYSNENANKVFGIDDSATSTSRIDNFFAPQHFSKIRHHLLTDPKLTKPKRLENLTVVAKHTRRITPVDLALSSVLDEQGRLAGYVFVMTDISDLKRAYAQLAEEEQKVEQKVIERTEELYTEHAKLEASIASLPVGFIMLDESMNVLELNTVARELLKIPTKSKKAVEAALHKLGVKEQFDVVRDECRMADIPEIEHDKKVMHLILSPIIGTRNDCIGCVILIEDITKQKIAERERNEFIVTASHEMRTPLTIVQGNLANALDPDIAKLDKGVKPLIEQAYASTTELSELFKDIMTVSEIDNGSAPHYENKTKFDYVTIIDEVIRRLRPKAEAKKLALSFSGHEKKISLTCDPNETKEIIIKLVENAIKYTTKGYVNIELKEHDTWALLSVTDTGVGIPAEDRKRLFKKFARLDNSLTREIGGTGLGLYIAQSLAGRNGGAVTLEHSTHKGSIFTLKLPLK